MITMEEKKPETVREDEQIIFALDIGTRSVIGLVGRKEGQTLRVLAAQWRTYQSRAVVDGRLKNIEETAKTAGIVKQRLEESLGFPLKNVYIAAAGRTLKPSAGNLRWRCMGTPLTRRSSLSWRRERLPWRGTRCSPGGRRIRPFSAPAIRL